MLYQNIVEEGCAVVSKDMNLSVEQKEKARRRIMEYPLPYVRYRLETERIIPNDQIDLAIDEWRKFMVTVLYADKSVGMISPIVDEVWHAHILFTREYAEFCQNCFETFVGHAPNWPGSPSDGTGGRTFIKLYEKLFGDLPSIWTDHQVGPCTWEDCTVDPQCDGDDCSTQGVGG